MLDVKIRTFPTHAASKPVAMIPNCAATRHAHFVLDGSGPVALDPPPLDIGPTSLEAVRVVAAREPRHADDGRSRGWKPGRDAAAERQDAHRARCRAQAARRLHGRGQGLPVDLRERAIYYVGPVDAVRDEVGRPGGPDDRDAHGQVHGPLLEKTGLFAMVGKSERGPAAIESIRKHGAAYLIAVGGAAYLVRRRSGTPRVVAFADLGMEAIYEFEVKDMPVTVAVDARGDSVHDTGPREWEQKIRAQGIGMRKA